MEHMRRSVDTAAHVTSAIEVDMARVVALRVKLKPDLAAQKVNLTYLAFIARATVDTLLDYPWVNGELRGQSIVTRPFVNLGIAVALDDGNGLIVPSPERPGPEPHGHGPAIQTRGSARGRRSSCPMTSRRNVHDHDPGTSARSTTKRRSTQPQSSILGTYALVKVRGRADELGGDVIGSAADDLTLTYDHRLVDGAYAGMCLRDIREPPRELGQAAY